MTDTVETPRSRHTLSIDRPPAEEDTGISGLVALIGLVLALGVFFGFSWVVVIATLVVIIFLHELGHYVTARAAGMKSTEFFLFFGPRIWSFRRGETEYGIKTVPLGAYVKIIGMTNLEEVDPAEEHRTYRQQPYWRRLSVAVAGSAMHFLIALVALFGFLALYGDLVPGSEWRVGSVSPDSAAARAGLQPEDRLLAVEGVDTADFDELGNILEPFAGQTVTLSIERDGAVIDTSATIGERLTEAGAATVDGLLTGDVLLAVENEPVFTYDELVAAIGDRQGEPVEVTFQGVGSADPQVAAVVLHDPIDSAAAARGFLGVGAEPLATDYSLLEAVPRSVSQFGEFSWLTVKGIGDFFYPPNFLDFISGAFGDDSGVTPTTTPLDAERLESLDFVDASEPRVLSPYGLIRFGNDSAESGFQGWLAFLIVINISIGVVNMIPLLPFDGGHVVIATYEKIRSMISGRRHYVDAGGWIPVAYGVLGIFLVMTLVALVRDIVDPIV